MGKVFVSYSHRDREAFEELWGFLAPLHREGLLEAWSDERIETGFRWRTEIDAALESATAAVLLVTQRFVASDFIAKHELPRLLARAREGKVTVLPVFHSPADVSFGDYAEIPELQGFGTPDRPLGGRPGSEREAVYVELAQRLRELAAGPPPRPSAIVRPAGEVPARAAYSHSASVGSRQPSALRSHSTVRPSIR